jgi:peptidoglycan hydrolase CwlO-like protein
MSFRRSKPKADQRPTTKLQPIRLDISLNAMTTVLRPVPPGSGKVFQGLDGFERQIEEVARELQLAQIQVMTDVRRSNRQNAQEQARLNQMNRELLEELEKKKFEMNVLQPQLDGRSNEIERLNGTLRERNAQIKGLQTQLVSSTSALQTQQASNKDLSDTLAHERNSLSEKIENLRRDHDSEVERIKAGHNFELEKRNTKHEERMAELEREYELKLRKHEDEWRVEVGRLAKRILDSSNIFSESEAAVGVAIERLNCRLTNLRSIAPVVSAVVTRDKKSLDTLRVRDTEKDTEIENLRSRMDGQEKELRNRIDDLTSRLSLTKREGDDAKREANEREHQFRNIKKENERLLKDLKVLLHPQASSQF